MKDYFFIRNDRDSEGGGVMFGIKNKYKKFTIEIKRNEPHHREETLWIMLGSEFKIRIGILYTPQENTIKVAEIEEIYNRAAIEISEAKKKEQKVILMGDLNSKVGTIIKGNYDLVSKAGKILLKFIKKYNLQLVNAHEKTEGLWTRVMNNERSVIDYIIIDKDDSQYVTNCIIDEKKELAPSRLLKENGEIKEKFSDHNVIIVKMDWRVDTTSFNKVIATKMTNHGYEKYKNKLKYEKISQICHEEGDFQDLYTRWSQKVVEIKNSCEIKIKPKQ